ncbi:2Fe-2S ferredoxin [Sphingomonas sp. Leaf407]|uniref:2Fe-2S iron-sulfur cluster-binding protein n=1 Tax=unclassified Sphingomonas TaxID=196159 RepID=UPI0007021623|nr:MULTISPECIES: 2Fe-2S iron-sulfur cluster-binding protein [unclassified Sphingomonas]KQN36970.1 2Fe-2S ferredoxin [Sphingomonas sp. Leaf42]KQT30397.1 2Fe-2S ferredoxin [Sphingomonas sp. Leaf407]
MIVHLTGPDGRSEAVRGAAGDRLLDLAQAYDFPLEGTCGGQMACSTCHVIVDPADHARLPAPSEEEEDMLDFAANAVATSRLACQIVLDESLDGLRVRVPAGARDARR